MVQEPKNDINKNSRICPLLKCALVIYLSDGKLNQFILFTMSVKPSTKKKSTRLLFISLVFVNTEIWTFRELNGIGPDGPKLYIFAGSSAHRSSFFIDFYGQHRVGRPVTNVQKTRRI